MDDFDELNDEYESLGKRIAILDKRIDSAKIRYNAALVTAVRRRRATLLMKKETLIKQIISYADKDSNDAVPEDSGGSVAAFRHRRIELISKKRYLAGKIADGVADDVDTEYLSNLVEEYKIINRKIERIDVRLKVACTIDSET